MESRSHNEVLLVGSLPFETTEDALRACARELGSHVASLPDGEVGERKGWIAYLAEEIYAPHPDLEETHHPDSSSWETPESNPELPPGVSGDMSGAWLFRIKPGVDELRLDTGYDRFAKDSYKIFRQLKADGAIPEDVAFQVTFPAPMSAVDAFFGEASQHPAGQEAYRQAVGRAVQSVLETVPAAELVVQVDICEEVIDLALGDTRYQPWYLQRTYAEKFEAHTGEIAKLAGVVPEEVRLGFHLCYGTWGGWPMIAMRDLRLCVDLANAIAAKAERDLSHVHMPVARTSSPEFYAPLADLSIGSTRAYLGLIHPQDGLDGFRGRAKAARQYLPDFGIAAVCGFGREDPRELGDIIGLHRACAAELSTLA